MNVVIIDYGMGNIGSVKRSVEHLGASVIASSETDVIRSADRIILPGVGAFSQGALELRARDLASALVSIALEQETPMLGICLGMQLLADEGEEGGQSSGLGLIPGRVRRMEPGEAGERLPHVGWNSISIQRRTSLFTDIEDGTDFYFTHSYVIEPKSDTHVAATSRHGETFAASVLAKRVYGVQFHPEKSSRAGLRLLENFLAIG